MKAKDEKLKEEIEYFEPGDVLYASYLSHATGIPMDEIYKKINEFVPEKLVPVLEVFCPNCRQSTGMKFSRVQNIPKKMICPVCGQEIGNPIESAVLVFKRV